MNTQFNTPEVLAAIQNRFNKVSEMKPFQEKEIKKAFGKTSMTCAVIEMVGGIEIAVGVFHTKGEYVRFACVNNSEFYFV